MSSKHTAAHTHTHTQTAAHTHTHIGTLSCSILTHLLLKYQLLKGLWTLVCTRHPTESSLPSLLLLHPPSPIFRSLPSSLSRLGLEQLLVAAGVACLLLLQTNCAGNCVVFQAKTHTYTYTHTYSRIHTHLHTHITFICVSRFQRQRRGANCLLASFSIQIAFFLPSQIQIHMCNVCVCVGVCIADLCTLQHLQLLLLLLLFSCPAHCAPFT